MSVQVLLFAISPSRLRSIAADWAALLPEPVLKRVFNPFTRTTEERYRWVPPESAPMQDGDAIAAAVRRVRSEAAAHVEIESDMYTRLRQPRSEAGVDDDVVRCRR